MPKNFECNLSTEELQRLYDEHGTLKNTLPYVGCKSEITLSKLFKERGIDMNKNAATAYAKRGNRTDEEFKEYLMKEYCEKKRSMSDIAEELNISEVIISRYLGKYGIAKRSQGEQITGDRNPRWNGGKHKCSNGYIEIYMPDYHTHHRRNYVYEHIYVAETYYGRWLNEDEAVHHKDRNKSNNSPRNLMIVTASEHAKIHSKEKHDAIKRKRG